MLRQYFDNPAITTDVIVGFPGETEREFELPEALWRLSDFMKCIFFKYSKRQGTKAAVMPDQVPENIKTYRSNVLQVLSSGTQKHFARLISEKGTGAI